MIYYFLLAFCSLLFSWQFVFSKIYQRIKGTSLKSIMLFTCFAALVFFSILFCVNGFKIAFSWFSFGMALLYVVAFLCYSCFGFIALKYATLAQYTLFAMLGGMMLPFTYGFILDPSEPLPKLFCFFAVAAGLFFSLEKNDSASTDKKKGILASVAVFIFNGLVGIISSIHQSSSQAVDSIDFFLILQASMIVVCFVSFLFLKEKKKPEPLSKKQTLIALSSAGGYGIVNGLGNLLSLICLLHVDPSAQYPLITGGCIMFSMIFGLFFGEKITKKKVVSLLAILMGTLALLL